MRGSISIHEYGENKLDRAIEVLDDFIRDATFVYEKATGKSWE